ncbi:MAG TPA: serine/threonine-protein kinase [Polyangiaceae bacterium]|nr:serine/threonine-protein kinase [Polyangiaceae bacterium]
MRRNEPSGVGPPSEGAAPASEAGARAEPPALPRPGELVLGGKFRVDEVLGQGGMGVVMAAEHITLGQQVAFKFLKPGEASAEVTERFVREARAAARIDNEHVVRVSDVGVLESGVAYMLMERLEGEDLSRHLRRHGPLPIDQAVLYLAQACDAVAAAHAAGVIHRDLKPSNLFLARRRDGRRAVKVLDFGISKASAAARDEVAPSLTRPGAVLGSPRYMSPEQVRDIRRVDHRTDVWSLGAVLYELLAGAPMYEGDTAQALYAVIVADPPPPLGAKRPDVPAGLEAAVARCAQKDPGQRFASVAELALAIAPYGPPEAALLAERAARRLGAGRAARQAWQPKAEGSETGERVPSAPAAVLSAAHDASPRRLWLLAFALSLTTIAATSAFFLRARPSPTAASLVGSVRPPPEPSAPLPPEGPGATTTATAATATGAATAATATGTATATAPSVAPAIAPLASEPAQAPPARGSPPKRPPAPPGPRPAKPASELDDDVLLNRR